MLNFNKRFSPDSDLGGTQILKDNVAGALPCQSAFQFDGDVTVTTGLVTPTDPIVAIRVSTLDPNGGKLSCPARVLATFTDCLGQDVVDDAGVPIVKGFNVPCYGSIVIGQSGLRIKEYEVIQLGEIVCAADGVVPNTNVPAEGEAPEAGKLGCVTITTIAELEDNVVA